MENPPIVKTEVFSDDEESPSKWVNTEGTCFICLTSTGHRVVMPLRRLLRHLQINLNELYADTVGNDPPKEWDLKVDLCKSCGTTQSKLFHLVKKLEKIKADVNDLLEETDISIAKSTENQELMENFSSRLMGNEDFSFEFLNNIRTMIRKQCTQFFRQPNFELDDDEDEALVSNVSESSEDEDSSADGVEQILNSTASSVCEEEETSNSSDSASSEEEPHMSDGINQQKNEKQAAFPSEESSEIPVASTSNCQGIEEMLNSTSSSVGEEEETSHSSDSENSSSEEEEPRRSDRANKLKKEKQAAMSSEHNSKTSVASTSNCQGIEEMLNSTSSSVGEEEETSHSSDSAMASEQEPRRSLRMKEKRSAVPSKESSEIAVASNCKNQQEAQSCEGKALKSSAMHGTERPDTYSTQNTITKMYHCKKCGKQSPYRITIRRHYESIHLNMRSFSCDICNVAVFAHRYLLLRHRRTCQQSLEKRQEREKDPKFGFVCEICGSRFGIRRYLRDHQRIVHGNVNRYPCDLCDKKFKTQHHLNEHKKAVHSGRKFGCRFCKKQFGYRSSLISHQKKSCRQKQASKAGD